MKRILLALVVLTALVGTYLVASPYWALSGLRDAIEAGDAASLEDRIDFPAVRESVAAEINAQMVEGASPEMADNPFGALAIGLASRVVEGLVDTMLTPSGLARLASGRKAVREEETPETPGGEAPPSEQEDAFADARLERERLDRFSVFVPNESGEETRFVFRLRGVSWVLTAVELPDFDL